MVSADRVADCETTARQVVRMTWQPAYGGAVLALRDHAGRIVATIDGPHPAGYVLTVLAPARATSLHRTLAEALALEGELLRRTVTPT